MSISKPPAAASLSWPVALLEHAALAAACNGLSSCMSVAAHCFNQPGLMINAVENTKHEETDASDSWRQECAEIEPVTKKELSQYLPEQLHVTQAACMDQAQHLLRLHLHLRALCLLLLHLRHQQ